MSHICILSHVPTNAVIQGFLRAARNMGLSVTVLTDHPDEHRESIARDGAVDPVEIIGCDVFNPIAVIDAVTRSARRPAAILTNSDHLQTSAAIVAQYLGLPGKDWRATYRAKNKAEMRRCLDEAGLGRLWHAVVWDEASLEAAAAAAPLPCIVKPRQGVASEEVKLAMDRREVTEHCKRVWAAEPEKPMLLEEFVAGPLCTLETLGDGKSLQVIGSYRTVLSPSPYFIELEGTFGSGLAPDEEAAVLEQLRAIGVGFGACHTELILSASGPRIVEVNYRFPGDQREFLMQEVLGIPLFERLLSIHLGEPLEPVPRSQRTGMIRAFTASEPGVLASVPSAFTRAEPTASLTYTPIRNVGDVVNVTHSNRDYLGFLRASGADINAVKDALDQAAHALHWDIQPSDAGFVEAQ